MKIITLLLALGLSVGGFVAPSVDLAPSVGAIEMAAGPAFAGVLHPGQTLLVSGTVVNSGSEPLDVGTASVHISPAKMVTRKAVSRWLAGEGSPLEARVGEALGEVRIGELPAGQTRFFSISVPATQLGFMTGDTGVYPLEIHLGSSDVNLITQRSVISWLPAGLTPRVNLSIVTPLNGPATSSGLVTAEELEQLTSPGGALYEQLSSVTKHSVAIGVDPMIVASIRVLGDRAPQSALDWLQLLEASPNDLFLLSYADSDQLLLREAGASEALGPLAFPREEISEPDPEVPDPSEGEDSALTPASSMIPLPGSPTAIRTTIDALAWPSEGVQSQADLNFLAAGGYTRTLISSSDVFGSVLGTPNITMKDHETTVSDDQISSLMRAAMAATSDSEWVQAAAELTATLAVTAIQSTGATVVATLARNPTPNSAMIDSTLRSVESLQWVNSVPLTRALTVLPVSGVLDDPSGESFDPDQVSLTRELMKSEIALTSFSSVADDPTLVTGPKRLQLLALSSTMWEAPAGFWKAAVYENLTEDARILAAVHLPESSAINLLQEKGNLPITVRNELDFPVTVFVTVRPERAILNVTESRVPLTIEANSQAKASVPVESIANGEVRTIVSLTSVSGVEISHPKTIVLNVQAGWETMASVVLALIVLGLFGAGIWRTVLRRGASRRVRTAAEQETS